LELGNPGLGFVCLLSVWNATQGVQTTTEGLFEDVPGKVLTGKRYSHERQCSGMMIGDGGMPTLRVYICSIHRLGKNG